MVNDLSLRHLNDFDAFHICFLSDGHGGFPQDAITKIKANSDLLEKFRITTVAFGNNQSPELIKLAAEFGENGKFRSALAPEDFRNALIEMIPMIHRS
jgi:hypothetical protein